MKKILLSALVLSLMTLSAQAATSDTEVINLCKSHLKGFTQVEVDALYSPYAIASYADGETGGQKLFLLKGTNCTLLGTDNVVSPLKQWNVPTEAEEGLAYDQAYRWHQAHKNVKVIDTTSLSPLQVQAYKKLGLTVK